MNLCHYPNTAPVVIWLFFLPWCPKLCPRNPVLWIPGDPFLLSVHPLQLLPSWTAFFPTSRSSLEHLHPCPIPPKLGHSGHLFSASPRDMGLWPSQTHQYPPPLWAPISSSPPSSWASLPVLLLFFSYSVVSDSLRYHGLQHARLPCPSPIPGAFSNSCPLSQWCHPTISSFVSPFSSCPQSFPASGSFPMSQIFASGGQSIGASALASVLPMNIQDWFPLGWTSWISLQSRGLSRVFSNTTVQKHQFFNA